MKHRFVDAVTGWDRWRSLTAVKAVSFEEYQYAVTLGGHPRLPESLVLEAGFQAASWLAILSSDFEQIAQVEEFPHAWFDGFLFPGERLEITVESEIPSGTTWTFGVMGKVGNRGIFRAEKVIATLMPAVEYHDPADVRTLASEIVRNRAREA